MNIDAKMNRRQSNRRKESTFYSHPSDCVQTQTPPGQLATGERGAERAPTRRQMGLQGNTWEVWQLV